MATPLYAPKDVPRIKNAKRLTAIRTKQLVRAAERGHDDPPPPPGLGECCGSSCDPCVTDLWKEELACWKERWGVAADAEKKKMEKQTNNNDSTPDDGETKRKPSERMPGSFDW